MAINCSMYVQYYKQYATTHGYYLLNVSTILQTTRYNARLLPARRKYNITNTTLQRTAITWQQNVRTILHTTRYNAQLLPARRKYNITNNTLQRTAITCLT